jgi:hypothetical protein
MNAATRLPSITGIDRILPALPGRCPNSTRPSTQVPTNTMSAAARSFSPMPVMG